MRNPFFMLLVAVLAGGCGLLDPEPFEERYVVESYQVAGEPLAAVRLSRTADLGAQYDYRELSVTGAEVSVELLTEDGSVEESFAYVERVDSLGVIYEPMDDAVVEPLRTYRLRARLPDAGHLITAQTLVPDTFSLVHATADTIVYQDVEPLHLRVTRSEYPGRQTIFVFSTEAVGPLSIQRLTPFLRSFLEEEEDVDLEDLRLGSSPILNEANYQVHADGTITIPLTWIAVSWYGPLHISATALDDNLYDFIRSSTVQQQGGATLAPGEIPGVLTHVDGATGVFGSYARVSYDIYVERNPLIDTP